MVMKVTFWLCEGRIYYTQHFIDYVFTRYPNVYIVFDFVWHPCTFNIFIFLYLILINIVIISIQNLSNFNKKYLFNFYLVSFRVHRYIIIRYVYCC